MKSVLRSVEFCVVDLETTGFKPQAGDEPIEVAAVRIVRGNPDETFQSFVNPRGTIPNKVQSLTGIKPSDVAGAPSAGRVLGQFQEFAGDDVLVAHNLEFDRSFLDAYAPRPVTNAGIDTLRMARKLLGTRKHSLDHLVEVYGLDRADGHRALDDARATAQLFVQMTERISNYEDYRRCGIPTEVVKEDLSVLLPATGLDTAIRRSLSEEFNTLSEVLEFTPSELSKRCGLTETQASRAGETLQSINTRDTIDLEPAPSLVNCYRIRYWSTTNWVLNLMGGALIAGGLSMVNRKLALSLMVLSVPFFLASPVISYFRSAKHAVLKQTAGTIGVVLAWLSSLYLANYLTVIYRIIAKYTGKFV